MARIKTYMGGEIVTDQDLQHWKYIRKYKSPKSGKWVYVYARKKDHDQIQRDLDDAEIMARYAKGHYDNAQRHELLLDLYDERGREQGLDFGSNWQKTEALANLQKMRHDKINDIREEIDMARDKESSAYKHIESASKLMYDNSIKKKAKDFIDKLFK